MSWVRLLRVVYPHEDTVVLRFELGDGVYVVARLTRQPHSTSVVPTEQRNFGEGIRGRRLWVLEGSQDDVSTTESRRLPRSQSVGTTQ